MAVVRTFATLRRALTSCVPAGATPAPRPLMHRALAAYAELARCNARSLAWANVRPLVTHATLNDAVREGDWPLTGLDILPSVRALLRGLTEGEGLKRRMARLGLAQVTVLAHQEIRALLAEFATIAEGDRWVPREDRGRDGWPVPSHLPPDLASRVATIARQVAQLYELSCETAFHGAYLGATTPEAIAFTGSWIRTRLLPEAGAEACADFLQFLGEAAANDDYELMLGRGHPTRQLVTALAAQFQTEGWPALGPALDRLTASRFEPLRTSAEAASRDRPSGPVRRRGR